MIARFTALLAALLVAAPALADPAAPSYPEASGADAPDPWPLTPAPVPFWEMPPADAPFALPPARRARGATPAPLDLLDLVDPETARQTPFRLELGPGGLSLTLGLGTEF